MCIVHILSHSGCFYPGLIDCQSSVCLDDVNAVFQTRVHIHNRTQACLKVNPRKVCHWYECNCTKSWKWTAINGILFDKNLYLCFTFLMSVTDTLQAKSLQHSLEYLQYIRKTNVSDLIYWSFVNKTNCSSIYIKVKRAFAFCQLLLHQLLLSNRINRCWHEDANEPRVGHSNKY